MTDQWRLRHGPLCPAQACERDPAGTTSTDVDVDVDVEGWRTNSVRDPETAHCHSGGEWCQVWTTSSESLSQYIIDSRGWPQNLVERSSHKQEQLLQPNCLIHGPPARSSRVVVLGICTGYYSVCLVLISRGNVGVAVNVSR
jgi:hypothetical protein